MSAKTKPQSARLVGIRARSRAGLLRSTALQAAVLLAIDLPGGMRAAVAQPAPNARPMGGRVVAGQATISRNPSTTVIDQSTDRAAINWRTFNVGRNQTVDFNQPSANSWTLNRVMTADPSRIAGRIDANGNIVLTNPSGVVFYRGAEVNANSALISAPGITNKNFMAGRMVFDQRPRPNARIVNAGSITVKDAGLAALVAPQVRNSGVITAKMGKVVLGGATAETLDMYGDGLLSFDVTGAVRRIPRGPNGRTATALVTNTGTVIASGGTVQLTARAADGIVQNLVDARGTIRADTAGAQTGRIEIDGTGGSISIAGNISAAGLDASARGGQIALNATRGVVLRNSARVDASGGAGGGTVAIGTTLARAQGGPSVTSRPTARRTIVKPKATVSADATVQGDGGTITLLSTRKTDQAGTLTARGGPQGGNGGMVEVSGEKGFSLTGSVDVSNRGPGSIGSILLDPTNLTVVSGSGNTDASSGTVLFNSPPDQATVSSAQLNALTGNITLQASNDLDVQASFNGTASVDLRAGHLLTIESTATIGGVNIRLDGGATFPISNPATLPNGNGGVVINGGVVASGSLEIAGGSLGVTVNGIITASNTMLLAATGPAGIQFGANSSVNAFGPLDLNTIGGGNIVQDPTSRINAVTLQSTFGAAGNVGVTSTLNDIGTLANFAATGSLAIASFIPTDPVVASGTLTSPVAVSLDIGGPLTVSGVISAPTVSLTAHQFSSTPGDIDQTAGSIVGTRNVILTADGSIDQTGGVIAAGTLSGSSGNNILITELPAPGATTLPSAGNSIANLGNFSSVGGFTLTDGAALTASGSITDTGSIGLSVTGPLTLPGTLNAPLVTLDATGDITQPSGGAILASTQLGGTSGGSISLPSGNNTIGTVGSFTAAGDFSLTGAGSLALFEPISVGTGHTLSLTSDSITFNRAAALSAPSGTVALAPLTPGWPVDFGSANNPGSLNILPADLPSITANTLQIGSASAGPVHIGDIGTTFTDTITLAPITTLNVLSGSSVTQGGVLNVATLTGAANSVTLGSANSIDVLGSFAVTNGFTLNDTAGLTVAGPVDATDVNVTGASLSITGLVTASGTADLIATNGAITEPGGTILAGVLTGSGTSVSLTSPANAVGTLGAFAASSGGFDFADTGNLVIGGALSGATVNLAVSGTITEAGGGAITTPVLTGSAGAATLDSANNLVGTLGSFTSSNGFALADGESLTVAGPITDGTSIALTSTGPLTVAGSLTAPDVLLTANSGFVDSVPAVGNLFEVAGGSIAGSTSAVLTAVGSIDQSGGALTAGALSGSSGATTNLPSAGNAVTTLGSFSSAGGFTLNDGQALAIAGPVTDTTRITIGSAGAMTASGNVTAPTVALSTTSGGIRQTAGSVAGSTSVALNAAGSIDQTGGSIIAGSLSGSSGATTNLPGRGNAVTTLGAFASGGGFTLADSTPITLAGSVSAAPSATLAILDDNYTIGAGGVLSAPAGTILLAPFNANAPFALIGTAGALPFAANTLVLGSSTAGPLTIGNNVNLSGVTVLDVLSGSSISEAPGTVLTVGTLEGAAGTTASFAATNSITTLNGFTAPGGFTLVNALDLTVSGPVNNSPNITLDVAGPLVINSLLSAPEVGLTATGAISQPGGSVVAGTLTGSSGSTTALTQVTNAIGTLGAFSSTGGFSLTNGQGLSVVGPVSDSFHITLNITGDLAVAGPLTAPQVRLNATGAIAEPGGIITTGTLLGVAASASLDGANTIATLDNFSSSGGLALTDTTGLTAANVASAGAMSLHINGPLAFTGDLSAGSLGLFVNGPVTQPSGIVLAGALLGTASSVSLPGNNLILIVGSFATGGAFTLTDLGPLAVAGPLSAGAPVSLSVRGNLSVTGSIVAPALQVAVNGGFAEMPGGSIAVGALSGSSGGGTDLPNPANRIASLGGFAVGAGFTLADGAPLSLVGAVSVPTGQTLAISDNQIGIADTGRLSAPSGTIVLQPFAGQALTLLGATGIGLPFAADTLVLGSPSAAGLTIGNNVNLADVRLLNALSVGDIVEAPGASITVGTLAANGASVDFTAGNPTAPTNAIGAIDGVIAGTFRLTDSRALTLAGPINVVGSLDIASAGDLTAVGEVNGGVVRLNTAGAIFLEKGPLNGTRVQLTAAGPIAQTGGSLNAGSLNVASGGPATLTGGNNAVVQLTGATSGSVFQLLDSRPLVINGPLSADDIGITAVGSMVLQGGKITTLGLPPGAQLGALPATPGSFLSVQADANGAARFTQAGQTVIDPPNGVVPTLRIDVAPGGAITLNDLVGPTSNLILADFGGPISGNINVGSLAVIGAGGNANLFGSVAGDATGRAAAISSITPVVDQNYLLNLCVIGSPTCGVIPPGLAGQNPQQLLPATQQLIASEAAQNEAAIAASVERPLVAGVVNECHAVGSLETLTPDCLDLILPNISNRDY